MPNRTNYIFIIFLSIISLILVSCCAINTVENPNADTSVNASSSNIATNDNVSDNTNISVDESYKDDTDSSLPNEDELSQPDNSSGTPPQEEEFKVNISDIVTGGRELMLYGDFENDAEQFSELTKKLNGWKDEVSLIIWSTDGSKALAYNTSFEFYSASTIKIAYALSCCKLIDEGIVDKDTVLIYEEKHFHKGDGGIKDFPFGTEFTIAELINKAVSISDNIAYEMLVDYFGYDSFNNFMAELGCNSLILEEGELWAKHAVTTDFLVIWSKLYNYFQENTTMSQFLKDSCTNTTANYATKWVAEHIDYSHKQGDYYGRYPAFSDAGIVWDEIPYVYVIFTNIDVYKGDKSIVRNVMTSVFDIMGTEYSIED